MKPSGPTPMLGFVARSGSGKTTLLTGLLPLLRQQGIRCAVIKHSHHDVEVDVPGKDSHRLRQAGANQILLASPYRCFWVEEGDGHGEPTLSDMVARLNHAALDLVLVEGFRDAALPKIEVHRHDLDAPLLCAQLADVIAVASDAGQMDVPRDLPLLPLNDPGSVAAFIVDWLRGD